MVELHCHSIFSDGELIPSELVRYAESLGYRGVIITDHVDMTNLELIAERFKNSTQSLSSGIPVLWGVEVTHVPPAFIGEVVKAARSLGAKLIIGHGESIVEPVAEGTNRAFIEAGVDILAHPGLITSEDARMAAEKGVFLELTTRKGHAYTNGHVLKIGKEVGARFVVCNDSHTYGDMLPEEMVLKVLMGTGLSIEEAKLVVLESEKLFERTVSR